MTKKSEQVFQEIYAVVPGTTRLLKRSPSLRQEKTQPTKTNWRLK